MGRPTLDEEARLVERAKNEPEAFLVLYELYLPVLYRYCYYRTGSKVEAEDAASETFLQAREYIHRYKFRGVPFSHWLYRVAGRIISSEDQRQQRETQREEAAPGAAARNEALNSTPARLDLEAALQTLPKLQQEAISLRYIQDLSLWDVARIMGRSEGAVKQLTFRALQILRERLGEK
jgi:RNA polymerase sigma-70 factor (ECF subfamily)